MPATVGGRKWRIRPVVWGDVGALAEVCSLRTGLLLETGPIVRIAPAIDPTRVPYFAGVLVTEHRFSGGVIVASTARFSTSLKDLVAPSRLRSTRTSLSPSVDTRT